MNDGSKLIFEGYKEGDMLRCIRKLERAKNLEIDNLAGHKVPVFHEMIVSPLLPEKEEGVRYIVNDMVARCNPDRNDFYVPCQKKYKLDGSKYYTKECFGLLTNPYYRVGKISYHKY